MRAASRTYVPNETLERPVSVQVRDLTVTYEVYEDLTLTLQSLMSRGFRQRRSVTVEAVADVSFDVHVGEAVGIVGSNGSGKSTLLRAVGGLQRIDSGSVKVRGESQLLGVGAALKPKLSGRRNVVIGGLAMGMSAAEIDDVMPDVVEFCGLGAAIDRPMNTYSSGMRSRLAFSIATLRVPEILLIDEALAVGDRSFRRRSLERIREIRESAGTVLMVTHNLNEIRQTCDRAIWIDRGQLRSDGPVGEVLDSYERST